jgi:hypothetical protein
MGEFLIVGQQHGISYLELSTNYLVSFLFPFQFRLQGGVHCACFIKESSDVVEFYLASSKPLVGIRASLSCS